MTIVYGNCRYCGFNQQVIDGNVVEHPRGDTSCPGSGKPPKRALRTNDFPHREIADRLAAHDKDIAIAYLRERLQIQDDDLDAFDTLARAAADALEKQ